MKKRFVAASFAGSLFSLAAIACGGGGSSAPGDDDGAASEDGSRSKDAGVNDAAVGADGSTLPGSDGGGVDAATRIDGASSSDAAGDVAFSPDGAAAAQTIASAYCAALQTCCRQAGLGDAGVLDGCTTSLPTVFPELNLASQGVLLVSQAGLDAWVAAFQQVAKDCLSPPDSVYDGIWVGTSAIGQSCLTDEECAVDPASDPVACVVAGNAPDGGSGLGVCRTVTHGAAGAECGSTCGAGEDCGFTIYGGSPDASTSECFASDGLTCNQGMCAAVVALGGACTSDLDCGDANYCDTTCKARVDEGAPCPNPDACLEELECGDAGVCSRTPFAESFLCQVEGI